jgi:cytochrome c oxidase cbb3-type subunit 3
MDKKHGLVMAVFAAAALVAATLFAIWNGTRDAQILRADPQSLAASSVYDLALDRGRSIFTRRCAACHGPAGEGIDGVPSLRNGHWLYGSGSVAELERTIAFGIRSFDPKGWNLAVMPAYARPAASAAGMRALSAGQIDDIVDYLFQLQGRASDRVAAARGALLFGDRAGCYDCHGPDGKGDPAIGAPDLTDATTQYGDGGRRSLFLSIAYGRQGTCPAWRRKLRPLQIREAALYVHSLAARDVSANAGP